MLTVNNMTQWQAFRWLWRYDSEAKWYWLAVYLFAEGDLRKDIQQNYNEFGATKYDH